MSHLDDIRAALPKAEGDLLFRMAHQYGVSENDDRFVMLAAIAPMVSRIEEIGSRLEPLLEVAESLPVQLQASLRAGSEALSERIEMDVLKAIGMGVDTMGQEVRQMARDLALSEFTAGSQTRGAAIREEVAQLRAAIEDYLASGASPTTSATASSSAPPWRGWVIGIGAFVVGLLVEAVLVHLRSGAH